jgi:hypothetical protein
MQEAATGTTNVPMHQGASGSAMGRAGGIAALLYALWLIYLLALLTVVIPSSGLPAAVAHDPRHVLPWVSAHPGLFTLLWLPEFLASFLLLIVVLALHDRLGALAPGWMQVASACGLLGTALVVGHTLVQNAFIPLASARTQDPVGVEGAFRAVDAAVGWLAQGGFFTLGVWMLISGWAALSGGGLPRWAAYTGLVAGLIALTALLFGTPAGALALLLWSAALAFALMRRGSVARPPRRSA